MTRRRPTPFLALVAAATLAAGLAACKGNAKPGEAELPPASGAGSPPRAPLPSLTDDGATAAATTDETTGTTFPRASAQVGPPLSGVIASIDVAEGDRVKKGQVLFRLRTTDLQLHVAQARAGAASAAVGLSAAQVEFDRVQRLFEKKAIEQAQLDRATAQLDAAKAAAEQAKVGVSMARQVMGDAAVKSPIDGVVTAKLKNAGEMATMMPPTVVVVVEDHAALELRFRLPEGKLGAIATGDTVKAGFAASHTTRDARVLRIAPSVDPATRTVEVVAMIDNADGALKAGMLANVSMAATAEAAEPLPEARSAARAAPAPTPAPTPAPAPAPGPAPAPAAATKAVTP